VIPAGPPSVSTYVLIGLAAAVEGEIVFVAASVLVGMRQLNPVAVLIAGALGAAAGDQFYFFAARGWLGRSLQRVRTGRAVRDAVLRRVRAHGAWAGFVCRFAPGVRIAIGLAAAAADVPALRFSAANLAGAFVWATAIMAFVAWGGPAWIKRLALPEWMIWVVPAVVVLAVLMWLRGAAARSA
jgi:membrane protein DedA with SNARE-associated domain